MHLNKQQEVDVDMVLRNFNTLWFDHNQHRLQMTTMLHLTTMFVLSGGAFVTILFFMMLTTTSNPSATRLWALVGGFAVFTICLLTALKYFSRRIKYIKRAGSLRRWRKEINQVRVSEEERQIFMHLIHTLKTGTKIDVMSVLDDVYEVPQLASLTFVFELRSYLNQ